MLVSCHGAALVVHWDWLTFGGFRFIYSSSVLGEERSVEALLRLCGLMAIGAMGVVLPRPTFVDTC